MISAYDTSNEMQVNRSQPKCDNKAARKISKTYWRNWI